MLQRLPRLSRALLCLPVLLSAGLATAARPEPLSPLAPFLGPWAGHLYGHQDCTMASAMPGWSMVAAVLLALAVGSLAAPTAWRARGRALIAPAVAVAVWCGLALLSVANSLA